MDASAPTSEQLETSLSTDVSTPFDTDVEVTKDEPVTPLTPEEAIKGVVANLSPEMKNLATDPKHLFSAMMHQRLQDLALEDLVEALHVNTDDPSDLDGILNANFTPEADKLKVQGARSNYPFLYDTTHHCLHEEVYTNVALNQVLKDNNCIITDVVGNLAVIIGSTAGFEYVTRNLQNKFCPIKQFFNQYKVDPLYFTALPEHVEAILNRPHEHEGSQVFDLSSHDSLFGFFEKVVSRFVYNVRFSINLRNLELESISDPRTDIAKTVAEEMLERDNIVFMLDSMIDVSEIARGLDKPYVYLRCKDQNGIAYRAKRIKLPNQKSILEFELFPLVEDNFATQPFSRETTNITKLLDTFNKAVSSKRPLIFCVGTQIDATTLHLALVREAMNSNAPLTFILNQENLSYHGNEMFSLPITQESMNDVMAFGNSVVLFGETKSVEQIDIIKHYTKNLVPVVAITSATRDQLPTELVPFVQTL